MRKSLLAHIASNFISEYENVANSSVAYLLNEYSAAKEALRIVLDVDEVPNYYVTELSTKSNGRPDVTGLNVNGERAVIIEGKFWANLTSNQPNNYLQELSPDGHLLFLAPDKRVSSLHVEVEKRLGGGNQQVAICSWSRFLTLVEAENNKVYDASLASDLLQFQELCQKMDVEGMAPLSASDLDPMNGRVCYYFSEVIDECNAVLRQWEHADFKGLMTSSTKSGYGFYFRGLGFGCFLHFSTKDWYKKKSHTPIWLNIKEAGDSTFIKSEKIYHYLNILDSQNAYDDRDCATYGIVLLPGMDKPEIVRHITQRVKSVLSELSDAMAE